MTRDEVISELSSRTGAPGHSVRVFLHAYFDTVKTLLRQGESVDLRGLGFFEALLADSGQLASVRYYQPVAAVVGSDGVDAEQRHTLPGDALLPDISQDRDMVDIMELLREVVTIEQASRPLLIEDTVIDSNRPDEQGNDAFEAARADIDTELLPHDSGSDSPELIFDEELIADSADLDAHTGVSYRNTAGGHDAADEDFPIPDFEEEPADDIDDISLYGEVDEEDAPERFLYDASLTAESDVQDSARMDIEDTEQSERIDSQRHSAPVPAGTAADDSMLRGKQERGDIDGDAGSRFQDSAEAPGQRDRASHAIEYEAPAAATHSAEAMPDGIASERGYADFSDDESFHRNRDQLYHPPERQKSAGLLAAAIALTVVVVIIILYMVYSEPPARELPGVDAPAGMLYDLPRHSNVSLT
jgi:hypothetical protein